VETESPVTYSELKAWMRSEEVVAKIVDMAKMLYDESQRHAKA